VEPPGGDEIQGLKDSRKVLHKKEDSPVEAKEVRTERSLGSASYPQLTAFLLQFVLSAYGGSP
jgi:hypothetical protein